MAIITFDPNAFDKKDPDLEKIKALAIKLNEKADEKLKEETYTLINDINILMQDLASFLVLTDDVFPITNYVADLLTTVTTITVDSSDNPAYNDSKSVEIRNKAKSGFIKRHYPEKYKLIKDNL